MDNTMKFEVEIADASGHSTVQMTKNELTEKVNSTQGSWVFVNDQLVSAADIAGMDLEVGSRIRLMPGLVGGQDAPTFVVEIADSTGHAEAVMTQAELVEKANATQGSWVFVNDQLVNTSDLADMNMEAGSRIRLMPGLVGGQDAPTFVVEIADSTGHAEAVMTQAELAEKASLRRGSWVFVNDQLVDVADIAEMNLDAGSRIRLMPGLVGGQDAPLFEVEIADATGHSTVQMSQAEVAEKANQTQGSWVFVNDQLVSAADIADMNLEAGSRIRLMPGLVGGRAC